MTHRTRSVARPVSHSESAVPQRSSQAAHASSAHVGDLRDGVNFHFKVVLVLFGLLLPGLVASVRHGHRTSSTPSHIHHSTWYLRVAQTPPLRNTSVLSPTMALSHVVVALALVCAATPAAGKRSCGMVAGVDHVSNRVTDISHAHYGLL